MSVSDTSRVQAWRLVRLRDIARVRYGKARPRAAGPYPAIGSGGEYARVAEPLVDQPTIVVGRKGTAGRAWFVSEPCWPSDTTFYLEWKEEVDPEFVFAALLANPIVSVQDDVLPSLKRSDLENIAIHLPSLQEQRAIARVLRAVQRAKEATEQVIAAVWELKKSLMRHLFTYGPVAVTRSDPGGLKETEIGTLPHHWQVVLFGDLFEIQQGKAMSKEARRGISPRPFLRTANVYWGRLDLSEIDTMDFTPEEVVRYELRPGDLLVCEGGAYAGRAAVWNGEVEGCLFQNHLHRCRPVDADVLSSFMASWLETAWTIRSLYEGSRNTSAIPNISKSRLASYEVPKPPLSEQREIVQMLKVLDRKIAAEEVYRDALAALFDSLLHDLMTAKLRVTDLIPEVA